ncbi:hypothetical protein Mal64_35090 [Pseudobythopirellula maris]|uniref:Uncharacterized protein n=1 Tax=Pseudobythopirellula maris TaxID=2527991 RepID=A0A5C5ZHS8_9BACT|nr:hypothetical protein Mal64_35090 [Pseudobythopirellula maris]
MSKSITENAAGHSRKQTIRVCNHRTIYGDKASAITCRHKRRRHRLTSAEIHRRYGALTKGLPAPTHAIFVSRSGKLQRLDDRGDAYQLFVGEPDHVRVTLARLLFAIDAVLCGGASR